METLLREIERDALGERLARLERSDRRSKRIVVMSVVAVALLLLCGARREEKGGVIQGERLMLKNEAGDSSIAMGIDEDGNPVIEFLRSIEGRASSMQIRLLVAKDGDPMLSFVDQAGRRRYKIPR